MRSSFSFMPSIRCVDASDLFWYFCSYFVLIAPFKPDIGQISFSVLIANMQCMNLSSIVQGGKTFVHKWKQIAARIRVSRNSSQRRPRNHSQGSWLIQSPLARRMLGRRGVNSYFLILLLFIHSRPFLS